MGELSDEEVDGEEEEFIPPTEEQIERFKRNVALEREKYQPTNAEKFFSFAKALLIRALVVFFLMWVFRRNSGPPKNLQDSQPQHQILGTITIFRNNNGALETVEFLHKFTPNF